MNVVKQTQHPDYKGPRSSDSTPEIYHICPIWSQCLALALSWLLLRSLNKHSCIQALTCPATRHRHHPCQIQPSDILSLSKKAWILMPATCSVPSFEEIWPTLGKLFLSPAESWGVCLMIGCPWGWPCQLPPVVCGHLVWSTVCLCHYP